MLIVKYFLTVGAVLMAGLFALNAHLAPTGAIAVSKPTTASLPVIVPEPPKVEKASLLTEPIQVPAKKEATSPRRSKKASNRRHSSR